MYIKWLIFSSDQVSLYPAVYFFSMWLSGIMTIMNSNNDRVSPWKIPLWIFASAKLLPPAVNSTFQVFMILSIKIMTSCDILYILRLFIIQLCGTISCLFVVNYYIFPLVCLSFRMYWFRCASGSLAASFLFFWEQTAACQRVVNFFPNLCC